MSHAFPRFLAFLIAVGCASSDEPDTTFTSQDGGSAPGGSGEGASAGSPLVGGNGPSDGGGPAANGGGGSGPTLTADACPPGQFANGIGSDGALTCETIDAGAREAITGDCSVYLGWRDDCDGCTTAPAKWGHSGGACANGAGQDNTCQTSTLSGQSVQTFGLNFDGDVDGNDKIYAGFHCNPRTEDAHVGPCGPGELAVAIKADGTLTCRALAPAILDYVRSSCVMYFGWLDGCDGCTTIPTKSGEVGSMSCTKQGTDDTCSEATLGGETVQLLGLNPDGDVDGNDKFYVGLRCDDAMPDVETAGACATGYFMTGYDGVIATCEAVEPIAQIAFTSSCGIYFGWRDGCDGCTTAPAKWGRVGVGACSLGAGADDTCSDGPNGIKLFGLNPDGDLDGNDKMYVGLSCD